jgi:iron-sulfur cluster repair protein YtfE (RIC family)
MLDELEDAEEPQEREPLLSSVEAALTEHMRIEEEQVYPLAARIDGELAEEAAVEHGSARELLQKLRTMGVEAPGFGALVAALRGAIEHHVDEEESELFPKLRAEFGRDLGERSGGGSPADARHDGEDVEELSRDELYTKAQELGIEGRSQMTKDELREAVAGQARR